MILRSSCALLAPLFFLLFVGVGCGPGPDQPQSDAGDTGVTTDGGTPDGSQVDADSSDGGPSGECIDFTGNIDTDTTLGDDSDCLVASAGITVAAGATLTIQPGTTIRFAENTGLLVQGRLSAEGTEDDDIVFTGSRDMRGWWNGIDFYNTDSSLNSLDHVVVEYAGGSDSPANLVVSTCCGRKSTVSVKNSTLRHSGGYGFSADNGSSFSAFTNNTVTQNAEGAGWTWARHVGMLDSASDLSGNDTDIVRLAGGEIHTETTWPTLSVPLRIDETISIEDGGFVTIQQGNTLEFAENVGLTVEDRLEVAGTEDAKVTFTGTTEEKGWWDGIVFYNTDSSQNLVDHAVVEYAGPADSAGLRASTCCGQQTRFAVTNSTLRDSAGYGFWANGSTLLSGFDNNTITANAQGGAYLHASTIGSVDPSNDFSGNGTDRIAISGELASEATWAAFTAPYAVIDSVSVGGSGELTIEAAATFEFEEGLGFDVQGTLAAQGTPDANVQFVGAESEKGYWRSLRFYNTDSTNNVLSNVVVADAGRGASANLEFTTCCGRTGSGTLENVTLQNGASAGLYASNSVTLRTCSGVSVENCADEANLNGTAMSLTDLQAAACE